MNVVIVALIVALLASLIVPFRISSTESRREEEELKR